MNGFPMLLAAADWAALLKIGIIVIAAIGYVLKNILQVTNAQKRPPARPDPRVRPRPANRPNPQDEVAEFLRRATEKRAAAKSGDGRSTEPRRAAGGEPVDPRILEMRAAAEKRRADGRPSAPVAAVEIVEARPVETPLSSRRPNTVRSHVDTQQLAGRAEQLAHVDRADAAFQAHMQVFDHQVGRLNEGDASPANEALASAGAMPDGTSPLRDVFASLLADPQSVRQAIVLNEIIQRPVERW